MVERLDEGHLAINKTIARAREVLFWPGMTVDLTEKVKNCPVSLKNRPSLQPEPLRSHEIPPLHWAKVGTYILHKNRRKWPELTLLPSMTSTGVITALRSQFARYGVPSVLFRTMVHVSALQSLKSFRRSGVSIMSLPVQGTPCQMVSRREQSKQSSQCLRKLTIHTKPSFHIGILLWRT